MATEQSVMAVIRAARPNFRNPQDKVVFAIHASFLASGYVLNATGPSASADDALSSCSSDEVGIDHWNQLEESYAFVYSKPEDGSKKVLVKCLVMYDKLLVDALKEGGSEPVHLEINVEDYVKEERGTNYSAQFKDLGKLISHVDKEILSKLSRSLNAGSSGQQSRGPRDTTDQPASGAVNPSDYPFYHPSGVVLPPVPPFGGSDLVPGSGAGIYPTRGGLGQGGGMLVGPHDPRFFGGNREPGLPGYPGGQPGVPPGARFDPYGPPGVPGFEPGRFVRDPRRPPGGTHPDLEHFGGGSDFI